MIGFLVNNQKVAGQFWAVKNSKPIKSFEEISQMTNLKERLAAINKETPKNKSILWRQNLVYQSNLMNSNQEQKAWVKEAYDFLDENFFTLAGGDESEFIKTDLGKSYEKLMIRRSELFTREESKKFCITFGDDSTLINSVQESNYEEGDGTSCHCTSSMCPQCPQDNYCSNPMCLTVSSNCGCFAYWNCTHRCTLGLP